MLKVAPLGSPSIRLRGEYFSYLANKHRPNQGALLIKQEGYKENLTNFEQDGRI